MDSPDSDWWIVHTGEYVLGLLDEQDALVLERVIQHEPDIEKMIANWSSWFQPISDSLTPIEPPSQLLSSLLANLPQQPRRSAANGTGGTAALSAATPNSETGTSGDSAKQTVGTETSVMQLLRKNRQQTDRWRAATGFALAAVLLLILFIGLIAA